MNCTKCGAVLLEGAKFCGKCGNKTVVPVCVKCGKPLKAGAIFCSACGFRQQTQPVQQPNPMPVPQQQMQPHSAAARQTVQPQPAPVRQPNPTPVPQQQMQPQPAPVQQPSETVKTEEEKKSSVVDTAAKAAQIVKRVLEHTSQASSAPGEMRISMNQAGGDQLFSVLGSLLK